ncbi:hypothetical protein RJ640_002676 [Escallonia rubra]|uniref:YTH domain-containing family protein n=1 Tax=Escallonia rubra TaxID=112253 RepID=A0AA88QIG8_9ASTE|nr:hypothetical protein RJ640_002676 [Escallonia rubra]
MLIGPIFPQAYGQLINIEKFLVGTEQIAARMKSDIHTKLAERVVVCQQDVAYRKDVIPSDLNSSVSYLGNSASTAKGEICQESDIVGPLVNWTIMLIPMEAVVLIQYVLLPPKLCCHNLLRDFLYQLTMGGLATFLCYDFVQGIHSDNGSLLYYLPGYDPYASGTFMSVDGQQPYYSSSGYLQHPSSYGSEALPCYSWDSTYVGDVTASRGGLKSSLGSNVSKSNPFTSMKATLDMKSRQYMASSNVSKPIPHTQSPKPLNKLVIRKSLTILKLPNHRCLQLLVYWHSWLRHLFSLFIILSNVFFGNVMQLGSGFRSAGLMKELHPAGNFSSFSNQNPGLLLQNSQLNYRPNSKVWNSNDRYKFRETSSRNGELESLTELTRGPRAQNKNISSAGDEQMGVSNQRAKFNLEEFQIEYENAKFYVIKSYSEDDIHKCIKFDVWSSTPNGNKKLDAAFLDAEGKASEAGTKCPVFLFFSVNGSGQFVGVAEMIGRVDFDKNMNFWQLDKWSGFFPVKWHILKDIPNTQLRHIILENNDYRPVTYTRDTQEIGLKQGLEMLNIFKSYSGKTSILDDFDFYENREKSLQAKRNSKPDFQAEVSKKNDIHKHIIDEASVQKNSSDATSSLINLTRNLSLHPRAVTSNAVRNPRDTSVPSISDAEAL